MGRQNFLVDKIMTSINNRIKIVDSVTGKSRYFQSIDHSALIPHIGHSGVAILSKLCSVVSISRKYIDKTSYKCLVATAICLRNENPQLATQEQWEHFMGGDDFLRIACRSMLMTAHICHSSGEIAYAARTAQLSLLFDPKLSRAHYYAGGYLLSSIYSGNKKNYQDVIRHWEKALEVAKNDPTLNEQEMINLKYRIDRDLSAYVYCRIGDNKQAILAAKRALDIAERSTKFTKADEFLLHYVIYQSYFKIHETSGIKNDEMGKEMSWLISNRPASSEIRKVYDSMPKDQFTEAFITFIYGKESGKA